MTEIPSGKRYDLEDRTLEFAKSVRGFVKNLANTPANREDGRQVIRSSGSVGANYIEANEALRKKILRCAFGSAAKRPKSAGTGLDF
jgi:four helix bundle protein